MNNILLTARMKLSHMVYLKILNPQNNESSLSIECILNILYLSDKFLCNFVLTLKL